jgi:hypothetical protein
MASTATKPENAIWIQNDSGAVIPPRSIVVVTSVEIVQTGDGQEYIHVHHANKYDGVRVGNIYVTGASAIPATSADSSAFPGSRSLGTAYSDQFTYVSIDQSITAPTAGEQWGPVPNQWYISRGGMGFFAQGHPASNGDATRSMFFRDNKGYSIGKFASSMIAGSAASPTTATVNTWHPDPASGATPKPLILATASGLAGITVVNYDASWTAAIGYFCEFKREPDGRFTLTSIGCAVS